MGESKNQNNTAALWGCAGLIGAALVTGIFGLVVALLRPTTAPIVIVVTATPQNNTFVSSAPIMQPTDLVVPPTNEPFVQPTIFVVPPTSAQCSHFQVYSAPKIIPVGMWVATRICSPARSACFYSIEQSSGGEYSTYEHNGTDDRRWVNAFCTETEAKNFANTDAKAMLEWWQYTEQNPFP